MASADQISGSVNIQKIQDAVVKLWYVVKSQPEISEEQKHRNKALSMTVWSVRCARLPTAARALGVLRTRRSSSQFVRPQISRITSVSAFRIPLLHLKRRMGTQWEYSSNLTGVYFDVLHEIATSGTTFKDKNAQLRPYHRCRKGFHWRRDPQRSLVRRCPCRRHHLSLQPCHR